MTKFEKLFIDQSVIAAALNHLQQGELVAFPTETVYGLGADASNESALRKLYSTKGRPVNHPVIVHLARAEQMRDWAAELSDWAKILAEQFWPGPLTLIVKKAESVSPLVTGGQDTVGLRVPAHPVALALLEAFSGGIAAPSANKYGRVSSTCAQHVRDEFGDEIKCLIDGGQCSVGIESTIVDTTISFPKILRPGAVSELEIIECLKRSRLVKKIDDGYDAVLGKPVRVPGSDKIHYAPRTATYLLDRSTIRSILSNSDEEESFAVLAFAKLDMLDDTGLKTKIRKFIEASPEPKSYAHDLYNNLRMLDAARASKILVELLPESNDWLAVSDRLRRAAAN
jgi:L-threonylcarbamoyladenylate synthase